MRHVQKVQTNGGEHIKRRALRADELARLISVSGPRGVVYRRAARTGIRRGELEQIEWRDVHLEAAQPFIAVRAVVSKNKSYAMQPLSSDAVAALLELLGGVAQRTVMELMCHSDMRLTAKTYTDAHMLPVSDAVSKLPSLIAAGPPSQIDSQGLVPEHPGLSAMSRRNPKGRRS